MDRWTDPLHKPALAVASGGARAIGLLKLITDRHEVPERITFRLAVLAYRCQHNMAPRYLTAQLQQTSNVGYRQRLRSSSSAKLDVPRPNTWPSVAVRSVQLQLVCGTVCQGRCSLLSHWTFFDAAWKLNCSSVLTTDTAPVKRLYCCVTHFHCSFLLWPQPWSLSTIILLWHSLLIIIIMAKLHN